MSTGTSLGKQFILLNGPLFIGIIFNWALFAAVTLQVYVYYSAGYRDATLIGALVGAVYFLDILQTIFATHGVWQILIVGWGDPSVFIHPPWSTFTFPIMSGLVAVLVQGFFAWRIWVLGKTVLARCISISIVLIGLMQCISGTVFAIQSIFIDILDLGKLRAGIVTWLVGAFACDIIIVMAMLVILRKAKNPVFDKTANLIDRLMIKTVHSGAVTAVAATVELVLFLVAPNKFMHITPALFLGKLYSNVLLANLNSRQRSDRTYAISGSKPHPAENPNASVGLNSIQITTFREVYQDTKPSVIV